MFAHLTEEEARVAYEVIMDAVDCDAFELERCDTPLLMNVAAKLMAAMNSTADAYKTHLIHQGVHPRIAVQHARHRFGT